MCAPARCRPWMRPHVCAWVVCLSRSVSCQLLIITFSGSSQSQGAAGWGTRTHTAHAPLSTTGYIIISIYTQNNSVMNRTRHSTGMYVPCFTLIARNNPMEPCSMPHTTQLSRSVSSFQASTISDHVCRARPYVSFRHRMLATDVETDCLLGCRHCRLGSFSSWCASSCRPACQPRVLFLDRLLLL